MKPVLVIPAYNATSIAELLEKIRQYYSGDLILIDDGSDIPIISNISDINSGISLLTNERNMGKGFSLRKAFSYVQNAGYSHAITIDADFQHDPKHIPEFITVDAAADIVIGKRNFSSNMPLHRRISNFLTSKIISIRCLRNIFDTQSGYRRYKLSSVSENTYNENGFQFETEVLLKILSISGTTVDYVSIETIYREEKSSIKNTKDTLKFIRLIWRSLFWLIN